MRGRGLDGVQLGDLVNRVMNVLVR